MKLLVAFHEAEVAPVARAVRRAGLVRGRRLTRTEFARLATVMCATDDELAARIAERARR